VYIRLTLRTEQIVTGKFKEQLTQGLWFNFLTAVAIRSSIIWDTALCTCKSTDVSEEYFQGRKISQESNQHKAGSKKNQGGNIFSETSAKFKMDCTALEGRTLFHKDVSISYSRSVRFESPLGHHYPDWCLSWLSSVPLGHLSRVQEIGKY
jgi:hypothetical protein